MRRGIDLFGVLIWTAPSVVVAVSQSEAGGVGWAPFTFRVAYNWNSINAPAAACMIFFLELLELIGLIGQLPHSLILSV